MPYEWGAFLWSADQWIISYSLPPVNLPAVKLFSIGHALELYLKASVAKSQGSVDPAIKMGHDVAALWAKCKALDKHFLPARELRPSVLACNILRHEDYSQLPLDDQKHLISNHELYVVAKHLADMKYMGAPLKSVKGPYALAVIGHNPMWRDIFLELRQYLGHPQSPDTDSIHQAISTGELPKVAERYLSPLIK
jgi:hypothetical protein